jgi:hypothetical protein
MPKEKMVDGVGLVQIRDFCVRGLAESVPEFMDAQHAEDILVFWFPGDKFALEALYRRLSAKGEPGHGKRPPTKRI